jgi:hypothetical protein
VWRNKLLIVDAAPKRKNRIALTTSSRTLIEADLKVRQACVPPSWTIPEKHKPNLPICWLAKHTFSLKLAASKTVAKQRILNNVLNLAYEYASKDGGLWLIVGPSWHTLKNYDSRFRFCLANKRRPCREILQSQIRLQRTHPAVQWRGEIGDIDELAFKLCWGIGYS